MKQELEIGREIEDRNIDIELDVRIERRQKTGK